jgi:outer membrane protein assembly factor BamB
VSGRVDTFCALNLETGEVRWQLDDAFAAGAPVIVGEALYLTIGDDLFALDAATGEEIWSVEDWLGENYEVLSPLVISGGRIVINAGQGLAAFGAPGS